MKNKYKVVALVPLEFSVEGSSDSKEAIESVKNIFEACRDDKDYADIVFDGIEGRSANGTHRSRVGNHRQACCLFWRGFDQRGMRRLCREQHITIEEVTQHG